MLAPYLKVERKDYYDHFFKIADESFCHTIDGNKIILFKVQGKLIVYFLHQPSFVLLSEVINNYIYVWFKRIYSDHFQNKLIYLFIESNNLNFYKYLYLIELKVKDKFFNNFIYRTIIHYNNYIFTQPLVLSKYTPANDIFINIILYQTRYMKKYNNRSISFKNKYETSLNLKNMCFSKYRLERLRYEILNIILSIILIFISEIALSINHYFSILNIVFLFIKTIFIYKNTTIKSIFIDSDYFEFKKCLLHILNESEFVIENDKAKKNNLIISFNNIDTFNNNYKYIIIYENQKHKFINKKNVLEIQYSNEKKLKIINGNKSLLKKLLIIIYKYYKNNK